MKIRPPAATAVVKVGNKAKEAGKSPELEGDAQCLQPRFARRTGTGNMLEGSE